MSCVTHHVLTSKLIIFKDMVTVVCFQFFFISDSTVGHSAMCMWKVCLFFPNFRSSYICLLHLHTISNGGVPECLFAALLPHSFTWLVTFNSKFSYMKSTCILHMLGEQFAMKSLPLHTKEQQWGTPKLCMSPAKDERHYHIIPRTSTWISWAGSLKVINVWTTECMKIS